MTLLTFIVIIRFSAQDANLLLAREGAYLGGRLLEAGSFLPCEFNKSNVV